MTFPGYPLDTTKTDATPTTTDHPSHHNALAVAANDLQGQVDALGLEDVDLQTQITNLLALVGVVGAFPGEIRSGLWAVAPTGWLFMGSSNPGANVAYPNLWAVAPAAWKSGTTLNLPSLDTRVLMDGGTLGASTGAMTHTLAGANLPAHSHAVSITSGGISADHVHSIAHDHSNFATAAEGAHSHQVRFISVQTGTGSGFFAAVPHNQGFNLLDDIIPGDDGVHAHNIDVPAFSGTSGGVSADHSHLVSGNTGNGPGSGTAVDHTPAALRIRFIIKT